MKGGRLSARDESVTRMLGIIRETRRVRITGLYAAITVDLDDLGALVCPVCGTARFYSESDLVRHLAYHARVEAGRRQA